MLAGLVLLVSRAKINFRGHSLAIREFKKTTTPTATGTQLNKTFNVQDNSFGYTLKFLEHLFTVLCKTTPNDSDKQRK